MTSPTDVNAVRRSGIKKVKLRPYELNIRSADRKSMLQTERNKNYDITFISLVVVIFMD